MEKYKRKSPKLAKEITCKRCGTKFYVKGVGRSAKYCIECKVVIYKEHHKKYKRKPLQ